MKTIGIITVRWDSARLRGKALITLGNKPLLQHTYDNLALAELSDPPIVVTTDNSLPIIDYCQAHGIKYVAGPDDKDILSQMLLAIPAEEPCLLVRVWGDNPFPFSWLVNEIVDFFYNHRFTYIVAHASDSYCSIVSSRTLERIDQMELSRDDAYDIHTWMVNNLSSCILNYPIIPMKLTIDTEEDLERTQRWLKSER